MKGLWFEIVWWRGFSAQSELEGSSEVVNGSGGVSSGLLALDFVWVSLFVGVVMLAALAYLVKRTGV